MGCWPLFAPFSSTLPLFCLNSCLRWRIQFSFFQQNRIFFPLTSFPFNFPAFLFPLSVEIFCFAYTMPHTWPYKVVLHRPLFLFWTYFRPKTSFHQIILSFLRLLLSNCSLFLPLSTVCQLAHQYLLFFVLLSQKITFPSLMLFSTLSSLCMYLLNPIIPLACFAPYHSSLFHITTMPNEWTAVFSIHSSYSQHTPHETSQGSFAFPHNELSITIFIFFFHRLFVLLMLISMLFFDSFRLCPQKWKDG